MERRKLRNNFTAIYIATLCCYAIAANAYMIHYQQQQQKPPPLPSQQQQQHQQQQPQQTPPISPIFNSIITNSPTLQQSSQQLLQPINNQQQLPTDLSIGPNQPQTNAKDTISVGNSRNNDDDLRGPSSHSRGPMPTQTLDSRDAGPVFRYHGTAMNATTVKLVWNLLTGFHADYFEIKYGPIPDATEVHSATLNGTARDFTIFQLEPDTLYQFRLQGYSGEHAYKPQLVVIKTPPTNYVTKIDYINKEITPLGVKAEAKSNQSIQLSWTEPEKPANLRNSIRVNIIRYYVNPSTILANFNSSSNNETSQQQIQYHYLNVTNARESRLIVQRLKPATEYAFAIKTAYYTPDMKRIFTQSGFSMDTIAKTFDLEPSPPRNFNVQALREESQNGQRLKLELSWGPPESPNGQLRGYVILFSHDPKVPDDTWSRIPVNDSNINNWYITNLKAGASYYFKMRAVNQRGQSGDTDMRLYVAPAPLVPIDKMVNGPIPANNLLMLIVICLVAILFVLFLVVSRLFCRTRRKPRNKSSLKPNVSGANVSTANTGAPKLNGFVSTNSNVSSTVTARVGTLARANRRNQPPDQSKPDFWISAMDRQQQDGKSNISEKSNSELNMAMVSIQRDSPQFTTQTQLAPALPEYHFGNPNNPMVEQQMMQRLQQQGHYHTGHQFAIPAGPLGFDQMDNATASGLMTLSKRQHQQLQKYHIQFANGIVPSSTASNQAQAPSPHQQPPPPPPLNIEQQQQPLYGTHQGLASTRSLRLHRPTLYDPVSGAFVQSSEPDPPNYNSHITGPILNAGQQINSFNNGGNPLVTTSGSNTIQFHHPHQSSTLLSRRSTNTLRSFQSSGIYGQLNGANQLLANAANGGQPLPPPPSSMASNPPLLQSHQAVINQLNNSTYPSLPLKHVSAVRPQIMSSLEDQIEMELAEKEQQQQPSQQSQQQVRDQ